MQVENSKSKSKNKNKNKSATTAVPVTPAPGMQHQNPRLEAPLRTASTHGANTGLGGGGGEGEGGGGGGEGDGGTRSTFYVRGRDQPQHYLEYLEYLEYLDTFYVRGRLPARPTSQQELHQRNSALITHIRAHLGQHHERFNQFKYISSQFQQGAILPVQYHDFFLQIFGRDERKILRPPYSNPNQG